MFDPERCPYCRGQKPGACPACLLGLALDLPPEPLGLDVALGGLPEHEVRYQHGVANVRRAVASGAAQAGVLLRPATVAAEASGPGAFRLPLAPIVFASCWRRDRPLLLATAAGIALRRA